MKIEYNKDLAGYNCPNCGAPVRTAICEYCGAETGFTEEISFNDYKTIKKKTVSLGFFNTIFPLIFALGFTLMPIPFIYMSVMENEDQLFVIPMMIIFMAVGVGAFVVFIKNIFGYLSVKLAGKDTERIVYGFTEDNITINNKEALRVKVLTTIDGEKSYMYLSTYDTVKSFEIGERIPLRYNKKYVMLVA